MKKLVLFSLLFVAFAGRSHAQCTGSSPTWTTTLYQASLQTCVTNASAGDTVNVSGT
jgi:hypothetical protein